MQRKNLITQELRKQCDDCESFLRHNAATSKSVLSCLNNVREASNKIDELQSSLVGCNQWSLLFESVYKLNTSVLLQELFLAIIFSIPAAYFWLNEHFITASSLVILILGRAAKLLISSQWEVSKKSSAQMCGQKLVAELGDSYSEAEAELNQLRNTLISLGKRQTNFQNLKANAIMLQQLLSLHLTLSSLLAGLSTIGELFEVLIKKDRVLHTDKDPEEMLAQLSTADTAEEFESREVCFEYQS